MTINFLFSGSDVTRLPDSCDGLEFSDDDEENEAEKQPSIAEILAQIGLQDFLTVFESERISIETLVWQLLIDKDCGVYLEAVWKVNYILKELI